MIPSWIRQLLMRVGVLAFGFLVIGVGVWMVSGSTGQTPEGTLPKPPLQKSNPVNLTQNTPVKNDVPAAQNADKAVLQAKAPKEDAGTGATKLISLTDAINLIEKSGKGEVVRAEKLGAGSNAQFNLDILGKGSTNTRFNLNATGKVVVESTVDRAKKGKSRERSDDRERRPEK